jgi:PIN domain nuclease of toxin-antitoxin system
VKVLLDTHVLLWSLASSRRIGKESLALIERSDVYVSAASILEIGIKAAIGRLKADPEQILAAVDKAGYTLLDVTGVHAARVFSLALAHPDPFDRLLVAQADVERMILLSADEALARFGPLVRLI